MNKFYFKHTVNNHGHIVCNNWNMKDTKKQTENSKNKENQLYMHML